MGAERYEIKELPTSLSSAGAASSDLIKLAFSGAILAEENRYQASLAFLNVQGYAFSLISSATNPVKASGPPVEATEADCREFLLDIQAQAANPEAKMAPNFNPAKILAILQKIASIIAIFA